MTEHKFKAFLRDGEPFGDAVDKPFVYDALADPDLPDPDDYEELKRHLVDRDAKPDVLNAAEHMWGLYQQHLAQGNA